MSRGTIFFASDYVLDAMLRDVKQELASRGFRIVEGPRQHPPVNTHFPPTDWERLFRGTDVIVTSTKSFITREILEYAGALRSVVFPTIGTESIDIRAASELGIIVGFGPMPENFHSMAESTVMLMLALLYNLRRSEQVLRENLPVDVEVPGRMLKGKTIGLVGTGRIARGVADRLAGWGVRILACNRHGQAEALPAEMELVPLDDLLRQSDIVSLHATLTTESRHMIGAEQFAQMKPDAFFINTARGGIVDERALIEALQARRIAGAALDTFEVEPLPVDSPLRALDNVILTPHMVGRTRETFDAIPEVLLENLERVMRGELPLYCRNPDGEAAWRSRLARLTTIAA